MVERQRTIDFTSACVCVCVRGGDPCWQLPSLQTEVVFVEACRHRREFAGVSKGVQARMLFPIGSRREAVALHIKPITHSQLTPDSLSAYLAPRLRANRQRQRRQARLCYWNEME